MLNIAPIVTNEHGVDTSVETTNILDKKSYGYVYVISHGSFTKSNQLLMKVGHTISPRERFRAFKKETFCNSKEFKVHYILQVHPSELRQDVEKYFHRILSSKGYHEYKEFFSPDINELRHIIEQGIKEYPTLSLLTEDQVKDICSPKVVKTKDNNKVVMPCRPLGHDEPPGNKRTVWHRLKDKIIPIISAKSTTVDKLLSMKLMYAIYDKDGGLLPLQKRYTRQDLFYDVERGYLQLQPEASSCTT